MYDEDLVELSIVLLNIAIIAAVFIQDWHHSSSGRLMIACAAYTILLRGLIWYRRRHDPWWKSRREFLKDLHTTLGGTKNPAQAKHQTDQKTP